MTQAPASVASLTEVIYTQITQNSPETPRTREQSAQLAKAWMAEAERYPDLRDDILERHQSDFTTYLGDSQGPARQERLLAATLDHRLRRLNVRSRDLGQGVIDSTIENSQAKQEGQALMDELKPLGATIATIKDEALRRPLEREYQETSLDALYAVDRKVMSRRLNHYASSKKKTQAAPAPPSVRPAP